MKLISLARYIWVNLITHKAWVIYYCVSFCIRLLWRAVLHDLSRLRPCEFKDFSKNLSKIESSEYGSKSYYELLDEMKESINHHYLVNSHHPEHFFYNEEEGVELDLKALRERADLSEMNLLDLTQMYIDWLACAKRLSNGDLNSSIEVNSERFKVSQDLKSIFHNTIYKI